VQVAYPTKRGYFFRVSLKEGVNPPKGSKAMKDLEKIKETLKALRQIDGVEGCWLEEEEGDILHVYTVIQAANYALQKQIFKKYAEIEERFPHVSFEFRTTTLPPSPIAEVVF
jgi:hypothetical protein